jgi:hypothetical protein
MNISGPRVVKVEEIRLAGRHNKRIIEMDEDELEQQEEPQEHADHEYRLAQAAASLKL